MSEPLFQIGESVWLACIGKEPVAMVVSARCKSSDPCGLHCSAEYSYLLNGDSPDANGLGWCEHALRKREPPDEEFDTFIKKLSLDKVKDKVPA